MYNGFTHPHDEPIDRFFSRARGDPIGRVHDYNNYDDVYMNSHLKRVGGLIPDIMPLEVSADPIEQGRDMTYGEGGDPNVIHERVMLQNQHLWDTFEGAWINRFEKAGNRLQKTAQFPDLFDDKPIEGTAVADQAMLRPISAFDLSRQRFGTTMYGHLRGRASNFIDTGGRQYAVHDYMTPARWPEPPAVRGTF